MSRARAYCICVGITLAWCLSASAEPVYLASYRDLLYRVSDEGTEAFVLDERLFGLHGEPATETVYATAREHGMFIVENTMSGVPSLTPLAMLSRRYGGLTRIGNLFYGFSAGSLYSIDVSDPDSPVETFIGATGLSATGGCAYDGASDTLYMGSYDTDALYTVDYTSGAATLVGSLGIDLISLGLEWWNDTLYIAAQNATSGDYEIGTLDVETGAYGYLMSLPAPADLVATGLGIIPEPATLGLLACGVLMFRAFRRR